MPKIYGSKYTKPIKINTTEKAYDVYVRFCDYCNKDSIGQYHCSGHDSMVCNVARERIAKDFKPFVVDDKVYAFSAQIGHVCEGIVSEIEDNYLKIKLISPVDMWGKRIGSPLNISITKEFDDVWKTAEVANFVTKNPKT